MSPLGLLNFAILQWFGVRLCITVTVPYHYRELVLGNASSTAGALSVAIAGSRRWCVLRWVWPLTGWWGDGWWGDFHWIARRPVQLLWTTPPDRLGAVALASLMALSGLGLALLCAGGAP